MTKHSVTETMSHDNLQTLWLCSLAISHTLLSPEAAAAADDDDDALNETLCGVHLRSGHMHTIQPCLLKWLN